MNSTKQDGKPNHNQGKNHERNRLKLSHPTLTSKRCHFKHIRFEPKTRANTCLDADYLEAIADTLKSNTWLTHLNLSGYDSDDVEASYLARKLYYNNTLSHYKFSEYANYPERPK